VILLNARTSRKKRRVRGRFRSVERQIENSGTMRELVSSFDWSKTPLGPIESWPQSLRTVVGILLTSSYAMWMAWGPELTFLYNDT
jgi:hypothetical protein